MGVLNPHGSDETDTILGITYQFKAFLTHTVQMKLYAVEILPNYTIGS